MAASEYLYPRDFKLTTLLGVTRDGFILKGYVSIANTVFA